MSSTRETRVSTRNKRKPDKLIESANEPLPGPSGLQKKRKLNKVGDKNVTPPSATPPSAEELNTSSNRLNVNVDDWLITGASSYKIVNNKCIPQSSPDNIGHKGIENQSDDEYEISNIEFYHNRAPTPFPHPEISCVDLTDDGDQGNGIRGYNLVELGTLSGSGSGSGSGGEVGCYAHPKSARVANPLPSTSTANNNNELEWVRRQVRGTHHERAYVRNAQTHHETAYVRNAQSNFPYEVGVQQQTQHAGQVQMDRVSNRQRMSNASIYMQTTFQPSRLSSNCQMSESYTNYRQHSAGGGLQMMQSHAGFTPASSEANIHLDPLRINEILNENLRKIMQSVINLPQDIRQITQERIVTVINEAKLHMLNKYRKYGHP